MKRRHFPCEVPAPVPKALGVTPPWKFVRHPILGATPPAHGALTEGPAPLRINDTGTISPNRGLMN
jgi:hypothetical protein